MARPKSITIKLTDKQRKQLKGLTGVDHMEVKFEAVKAPGRAAGKALAGRTVGRSVSLDLGTTPTPSGPITLPIDR